GTNLENATLTGCKIYGVNCWDVKLSGAEQSGLIISKHNEPIITVDGLEVAQFIYLMLNNEKIRDVINTIGKKAVLILGRFNLPERKAVLNALREKLTRLGFLPIVFDFERPTDRDFTETIKTLAGMCRFIIADITNPKSTPLELQALVPDYMIPFAPIIQKGYDEQGRQEKPFAMLADLQNKYRWILDVIEYDTQEKLIANLEKAIIEPAIKKHNELIETKAQRMPVKSIDEFANQDNGL
ncbi:MAG: pentapeptide repeat-containing protein, partial [Chloroflexi bacterium]|nr:pentapeptide repeat-containing protein [Chloroflexota bacterium]